MLDLFFQTFSVFFGISKPEPARQPMIFAILMVAFAAIIGVTVLFGLMIIHMIGTAR